MTKKEFKERKKRFGYRLKNSIIEIPTEIKYKNVNKLLETKTILLPELPSHLKTREIASNLSHIEQILQEIEFFEREKRKKYYETLIDKISNIMDENLIDIEDLKDSILFGNSFDNIVNEGLLTSFNLNSFLFIIENSKDLKIHHKLRKMHSRKRGTQLLRTIKIENKSKQLCKIEKNNKVEFKNNMEKQKLDLLKDPLITQNTNKKIIFNTTNTVKTANTMKEPSQTSTTPFQKSGSIASNSTGNKHFSIQKTPCERIKESKCFKCFNLLSNSLQNKCICCQAQYHSTCELIKSYKILNENEKNDENRTNLKSICNYCIKIISQKQISKHSSQNIKLIEEMEENLIKSIKSGSILLKQNDLIQLNYKCHKLEEGIIKLNSLNNSNNHLFMKFTHKFIGEIIKENDNSIS